MINRLYYGADTPPSLDLDLSLSSPLIRSALNNIYERRFKHEPYIEPTLYDAALTPLADAVEEAFPDRETAFKDALLHSAEVFAAFKVHTAAQSMTSLLLDSNGVLKPFEQWSRDVLPIASHQMGSWLRTEYNTAILRAHQAADWQQYEAQKDVLPNLRWVPSTSATPGKDHLPFWGTVLPVDHPFWSKHRPGDRWNCKCSLEATDDDATPVPDDESARLSPPQKGLESNPGKTAQLFDQSHPYFPDSCAACSFNSGLKNSLTTFFGKKQKDCCNCQKLSRCLPDSEVERKKAAKKLFRELSNDPQYTKVQYNKVTGGLVATHVDHIEHDGPNAERFFDGLTSSDLERECQHEIFRLGHTAIMLNESFKVKNNFLPALDLNMDGTTMDIASVTGRGWYSNIFVRKNNQLRRYNEREDISEPASAVCLYFHDPRLFSEEKMMKSINYFRHYRDQSGNLINRHLTKVYCVLKGGSKVLTFEI